MLFHSLSLTFSNMRGRTHTHTYTLTLCTCKADILKGVVGLSHSSSGALVKVLLPPLGSSQESRHMLCKRACVYVSIASLC